MGNEVGREPEGGAQQQGRSLRDNFIRFGASDGGTVSSTAVGAGDGDGDAERRRFRDIYMLQGRIGESRPE